ncbi:MAG: SusD/RagB family nutrient-binding outer membrane lipoprotein [Balneolaceae bacterium]
MKKLYILFIALFFLGSCDMLDFDDNINVSPNSPSQASGPQLIANAMRYLPGLSASSTGENGNFLAQYLSETQYVVDSRYPEGGTSFYTYYQNPLINLETVLNTSTSDNQLAVAKILKAYFFWHVTDRWGDVPYSEALQGADDFTPAYDTQESIYDNLFALLDEADSQINESVSLDSDIMYGGDMSQWKKFGNTVRLLMALRLSEVNEEKASAEFSNALDGGIMESNDDNFAYEHLSDASNQNYWYGQVSVQGREWWALSETLVNVMEPVDDPRLPVYGDPARTDGEYAGLPIGSEPAGENTEDFSLLGEAVRQQDSAVHLVTYAQALFAKAEAAELGWISEDAETNYNEAVENSILQWTGSTDEAAAFLAQPEIAYDGSIERIATQRYVHLFLHGYEGWAEWRRTGYPDLGPSFGNDVPTRQSYTSDEAFNNTENYEAAVERQFDGDNGLYGKIWWDAD